MLCFIQLIGRKAKQALAVTLLSYIESLNVRITLRNPFSDH